MKRLLIAVFTGLLLAGLGRAETLTVSAAASLADVLRELAPQFEAAHPGVQLRFNTGASGLLVQQLRFGAPADVLLTADEASLDQAASLGLLRKETRVDVAGNVLVLVEPSDAPPRVQQLADVAGLARIAIGKPASVPAGRYARAALERAGLWAALQPKLVQADNVRQALDYVARGEVQAGFVYASDAALQSSRLRVALRLPERVRYPGAITQASRQPELAASYLLFLRSRAAQEALVRFGFTAP